MIITDIDQFVETSLIKYIEEAFIDAIPGIYKPSFKVSDNISESSNGYIAVQYCYDKDYNRIFIEYELSRSLKHILPWELIVDYINDRINKKMIGRSLKETTDNELYRDDLVGLYPEIIKYEDGYNQIYDSTHLLNIYTIGYWKCLVSNKYEFLYSRSIIDHNMKGINATTDNSTPDKKLEDLQKKIEELYDKYKLNNLSEEDKRSYIKEYNGKNTEELNKKYNVSGNNNSQVPKIMTKYAKIYKDFFGVSLHNIIDNTKRFYINIYNL